MFRASHWPGVSNVLVWRSQGPGHVVFASLQFTVDSFCLHQAGGCLTSLCQTARKTQHPSTDAKQPEIPAENATGFEDTAPFAEQTEEGADLESLLDGT